MDLFRNFYKEGIYCTEKKEGPKKLIDRRINFPEEFLLQTTEIPYGLKPVFPI
jgi:hypothetical protein